MSGTRGDQLRVHVAPLANPYYPTPWRVAETRGEETIVVEAEGSQACSTYSPELAEIIVAAVNAWAGVRP